MFLKFVTPLLTIFKFFIIFAVMLKLIDLATDYTPFVYGLKTKQTDSISYLPNVDPNILPGNVNSIAVYSTHIDTSSIEEIFKIGGMSYYLCKNLEDANGSKIIFLDLDMDHKVVLDKKQIAFLYDYVSKGGTVVGSGIESVQHGVLRKLFGYRKVLPSRTRKQLFINDTTYTQYLNRQEEKSYMLSTTKSAPFTSSIIKTSACSLAKYEDGSAAISQNKYGKGKAIMFGISPFDLRFRNLYGKDFNANKKYCNDFEPLSDMLILFLRGIYENEIEKTITLATAPYHYKSSLVVTHDVDYVDSIENIKKFVDVEKELGIRSTFFIQTKYLVDDKDKAFFDPEVLHIISEADKNGFEIGSHTVMHTKNFFKLKEGNYSENYPSYNPFSLNEKIDLNRPTLSGELKVSKELLGGLGIDNVVSFRSGNLVYNPKLPIAMEKLGYKYSSCFSSEDILSYFPYRYKKNYAILKDQSYAWELPLTYEDEEYPPLFFRVNKALALFEKIHENGGIFNLLIHPDLTIWRLKNLDIYFEKAFIKKLPKDVWIAPLNTIGDFWDKRDRIIFRYSLNEKLLNIDIYSKSDINGIAFDMRHIFLDAKENKNVKIYDNRVVLDIKKGFNHWSLKTL